MVYEEVLAELKKYVPMKQIDKYIGCLLGGAVGDALGGPVEFLSLRQIKEIYGEQGIRDLQLKDGVALITDDTQMTLFTAAGYLLGAARAIYDCGGTGANFTYCERTYDDWLYTQTKPKHLVDANQFYTWLIKVPELHSKRAPGLTCLAYNNSCSIEYPTNDSKGCGGVMRVAPVGLIYPKFYSIAINHGAKVVLEGANCAALTHGGELGYIPAGCFAQMINLASHTNLELEGIIKISVNQTKEVFGDKKDFPYFEEIMHKAINLSKTTKSDEECIAEIGQGWVAEEALAIAVYCSLRHSHDFLAAICAAVNHSGDSDSTGSITGQLLGAYLGVDAIPQDYILKLELKEVIFEIAIDLALAIHAPRIHQELGFEDYFYKKYIEKEYDF